MWHQLYSQQLNGLGIRVHLMFGRTEEIKCKWINLKTPVSKCTLVYLTHYFQCHWNDCAKATEILPFEKSAFSASSFSSSLSQEQGSCNDRKEWWRSRACRMAPPRPLCHQGVQQLSIKKPVWFCLSVGFDRNLCLFSVAFVVCCQNGKVCK